MDHLWTIGTRLGAVFDPCWTVAHLWIIGGPFVDQGWIICGFLYTSDELLVASLLDRIGFLGLFVIGLSVGMVCVIAVL